MMAITHAVISAAGTSLILGKTDTLTIGLAILGSQLPDLDTSTSLIGQCCFPLSRWIESKFPHRTITHSLLASVILFAIALTLGYYFSNNLWYFVALPLGHLLSCFSDTFTKQGVQFFYPSDNWCISVSNPHRRIKTGSTAEYYVLVVFSLILVLNFSIISNSGSLSNAISLNLGLRNDIVKVYNKSANSNLFTATIKGYYSGDRSVINNEEFTIIGNEGIEFYLLKEGKVYKTGENIIVEKLNIAEGKTTTTTIETINLDDEDINNKLEKYKDSMKQNNLIFISGNLTIDYPEDIILPEFGNNYPYIKISNFSVALSYCPLYNCMNILSEQYGVGQINILIKSIK